MTILIEEGFNAITESNSKSKEDLKEKLGIYTMNTQLIKFRKRFLLPDYVALIRHQTEGKETRVTTPT